MSTSPQSDLLSSFGNEKTLLRFITAGSVDDGKSTLIGRLLYDSQNVYEDQLAAAGRASARRSPGEGVDLSLLTDGLRAEREQGITIDVAYRYFATDRRKFILADTPGHEQYTRNMATAASTAELAILLIDARHGLRTQTRRHAHIAALFGIRHHVVAVNKMDLVGYDEQRFRDIERDFRRFAVDLPEPSLHFIPLSAFAGDHVVTRSQNMSWFEGAPLLELLETIEVEPPSVDASFFFPIQSVVRREDRARGREERAEDRGAGRTASRGYAGQIASGAIAAGDPVVALPSGRRSHVERISTFDGDLPAAHAPMSVTLLLEDELDLGRGDALCAVANPPAVSRSVRATLIWFGETPLDLTVSYIAKQTTHTVRARIRRIVRYVEIESSGTRTRESVAMNDIVVADLEMSEPLVVRRYAEDRTAGSFILMDRMTNATVAAGLIEQINEQVPARINERINDRINDRITVLACSADLPSRVVAMKVVPLDDVDPRDASPALLRQLMDEGFALLSAPADQMPCPCMCHHGSHSPP